MTEDDAIQATADNLRADFLNADSNWARWKVFNRALGWAVTTTENADAARRAVQTRRGTHAVAMGDKALCTGDVVTWDGDEEGWIVREIRRGGRSVVIVPLGDDWEIGQQVVDVEDLLT